MSLYRLERRQLVAGSLSDVFAFFKDPHNLKEITPPWLGFRMISASDHTVRKGTRLVHRLRWHFVPLRWESHITEYREDERFADEIVRGPYRRWYHLHTFVPVTDGVEIRDRVEYELPFGPLGRLAHATLVRRQLDQIFDYRQARLQELFCSPP